jgi:hypothetical protein
MAKNAWGRSRPKENPYAIYGANGWTWNVLKAYQTPEKEKANPYARWYTFVTSPYCPEGEYGDTYVKDIVGTGAELYREAR